MEDWQIIHIKANLPELIKVTRFNCLVKAELVAQKILNNDADVDWLNAQETVHGITNISNLYYKLLMERRGAYKVLTNALIEANQSGAARILIRVPPELFTDPLTCLGISIEANEFQNVEFEVNGKTFKTHEFFAQANLEKVQSIFLEIISELEVYDSFITKEKTFVLAKNTIPPKPSYYVPRSLSHRTKLDKSIFKEDCPDIFVFKNGCMERYKLKDIASPHFTDSSSSQLIRITVRFIYLDEDEHWVDLKEIAKEPIHLINFDTDQDIFLLEDTSAASNILRKFTSKNAHGYVSENEFVKQQISEDCKASSVCICDTPGMGKTFLLAHIAHLMTEFCTNRIVAFIPLSAFATEFYPYYDYPKDLASDQKPLFNVLRFVSTCTKHAELLFKLVKAKLIFVEVFFDGFDEIPLEKVNWTKQVFKSVTTEFPQVKMYISSRPHARQELEASLGVIAKDILPFKIENQTAFLVRFWSQREPNVDEVSLKDYAINCQKAVNSSLTKKDKEITGIPLLCRLIGEIYLSKLAHHLTKKMKFDDVVFKIALMYQEFIQLRISSVASGNKKFEDFKLVHIWHALKLLFPKKDFHENEQFQNVKELLTSAVVFEIGIIQQNPNSAMEFIHRTFAEYLVADYFSTMLQDEKMTYSPEIYRDTTLIFLEGRNGTQIYSVAAYDYDFVHFVIAAFLDSILGEVVISGQAKSHVAIFLFMFHPTNSTKRSVHAVSRNIITFCFS